MGASSRTASGAGTSRPTPAQEVLSTTPEDIRIGIATHIGLNAAGFLTSSLPTLLPASTSTPGPHEDPHEDPEAHVVVAADSTRVPFGAGLPRTSRH